MAMDHGQCFPFIRWWEGGGVRYGHPYVFENSVVIQLGCGRFAIEEFGHGLFEFGGRLCLYFLPPGAGP